MKKVIAIVALVAASSFAVASEVQTLPLSSVKVDAHQGTQITTTNSAPAVVNALEKHLEKHPESGFTPVSINHPTK